MGNAATLPMAAFFCFTNFFPFPHFLTLYSRPLKTEFRKILIL